MQLSGLEVLGIVIQLCYLLLCFGIVGEDKT